MTLTAVKGGGRNWGGLLLFLLSRRALGNNMGERGGLKNDDDNGWRGGHVAIVVVK
jgi:hypothetical protein